MVLPDDGGDYRQTTLAFFWKQVTVNIVYDPPVGKLGKAMAKLFGREPNIQARQDLRRFKQLMETGEIPTSAMNPSALNEE